MPNALPPHGNKPRRPARPYNDLEAEVAKFTDPRIAPVLRGLQDAEAAVALDWAYTGGSWAESAAAVGLAPAVGERVRRKLKRLGTRYTERCSAARAFTVAHRAAVAGAQEVLG
ncbi:hypothetical protein [Streptomyces sp. bgisy153]|uniref:hypothetical protein n=1 Tax=Streptomyces sp. bgisy153 TaxID=3413793 RepID=UPI003D70FD46